MARFRSQKVATDWLASKAGYFHDNDTEAGKWVACILVKDQVNPAGQVFGYGETPMVAIEEAAKLAGM